MCFVRPARKGTGVSQRATPPSGGNVMGFTPPGRSAGKGGAEYGGPDCQVREGTLIVSGLGRAPKYGFGSPEWAGGHQDGLAIPSQALGPLGGEWEGFASSSLPRPAV